MLLLAQLVNVLSLVKVLSPRHHMLRSPHSIMIEAAGETAVAGSFVGKVTPTLQRDILATEISLPELLSTCIDAAQRGCAEIRRVHNALDKSDGTIQEVDYKIVGDSRSALTAADLAAQIAVVEALERAWPGLQIVGEEDMAWSTECDATKSVCASDVIMSPMATEPGCESGCESGSSVIMLRRDLCKSMMMTDDACVAVEDVTVFVDPLDGTREFVEGRVWNVGCLVGVAVNGEAVAGAIGLPFASGSGDSEPAVVYALVGAGPPKVYGNRADPRDPVHGGGVPEDGERPLLVAGDVDDPALAAAYATALSGGGRNVLLGGTGQKCLAVAEGRADVAIMNFKSSLWDTCAPEALVRAAGGELTDLFGERLVYLAQPPPPATYLNACGVIASAAGSEQTHRAVCEAMRFDAHAVQRLDVWGLDADAWGLNVAAEWGLSSGVMDSATASTPTDGGEMGRVLRSRRAKLLDALTTPVGLASLQRLIGLTDAEWKRIRTRVPQVEAVVVHGAGAVSGWQSLRQLRARLGLTQGELKAIVLRLPQLLAEDYRADVAPSLDRMEKRLELDDAELRTLVTKLPQMLGLDYDQDIAPKLEAARIECDGNMCRRISDEELKAKVLAKPSSIGLEVRGHFRPRT